MSRAPLSLAEGHEWAGLWWLPDEPDSRVPGILRYDPKDGLSLSLIGAFEDRIMTESAPGVTTIHEGNRRWRAIHGVAEQR